MQPTSPTTAPTAQPAIDLEADLLEAWHRAEALPRSPERDALVADLRTMLDELRKFAPPAGPTEIVASMRRPKAPKSPKSTPRPPRVHRCNRGYPSPSCPKGGCGKSDCRCMPLHATSVPRGQRRVVNVISVPLFGDA